MLRLQRPLDGKMRRCVGYVPRARNRRHFSSFSASMEEVSGT
jgi:hypothetical protein